MKCWIFEQSVIEQICFKACEDSLQGKPCKCTKNQLNLSKMKLKIIYNPKEVTNKEIEDLHNSLLEKSIFQEGDTVRLKGDTVGPTMVVTSIYVNKSGGNYSNPERAEMDLFVKTHWFNRSSQTFKSDSFPAITLIIVDNESKNSK